MFKINITLSFAAKVYMFNIIFMIVKTEFCLIDCKSVFDEEITWQ